MTPTPKPPPVRFDQFPPERQEEIRFLLAELRERIREAKLTVRLTSTRS